GVDDVAVRGPVLAAGERRAQPGLDADEYSLAVGRAGMALGKDGDEPPEGHLRRPDQAARDRHQPEAVPPGRLEQGSSGARAEGADREDGCHAEPSGGDDQRADEQAAARDHPAALEVLLEVLALLLGLGQEVTRLLIGA